MALRTKSHELCSMKIDEMFKQGKEFIEKLKPSDKVILVHHKDADGTYSAAIVAIALQRLNKKIDKIITGTTERSDEIVKAIQKYNKAIIVDIGIDLLFKELNEMNKEILYIDHHLPVDKKLSEKIVYINPRLENEKTYQPATYVVYKFFSQLVDLSDKEWLAVIGTIGDYGYEDCRDLLDKYIQVKQKGDIWKTKYGKAVIETVGAATEIGFNTLLKILIETNSFGELVKNKKIKIAYRKYQKLYDGAKKQFWKNAEKFDNVNLIFSVLSSKAERVGSAIATETSTKYPDKIFFLLEKVDDFYKIHARYQKGKINLGKLLREMGVGGGHVGAAGGKIKIKDMGNFKKRLLEELGGKVSE